MGCSMNHPCVASGSIPVSRSAGWLAILFLMLTPTGLPGQGIFIRGDVNDDATVNIADPIALLDNLFLGGPAPPCADAADGNDDETLNITDPIAILDFLFVTGIALPPPTREAPGVDLTGDGSLSCRASDEDGDGVPAPVDNCPETPNQDQADLDGDGSGDACDSCPLRADPRQVDSDGDGRGDVCESYWDGVTRRMSTSPYGNIAAIACHNCYFPRVGDDKDQTGPENLRRTLDRIHQAQAQGADLIELDLKFEGGEVYIDHEDDGSPDRARLSDVLSDPALSGGDQILFMEFKEDTDSIEFAQSVLDVLRARGFGKAGRPVCLRAFNDVRLFNLMHVKELLSLPQYEPLQPHVRLHVLLRKNELEDFNAHAFISLLHDAGFHGVEFNIEERSLLGKVTFARSLGLGINLYTIPDAFGEVFVAGLREEVDALTVDLSVEESRAVVQDPTGLFYLNTWSQTGDRGRIGYFLDGSRFRYGAVGGAGLPTFEVLGTGEDRYGGSLVFAAGEQRSLGFTPVDNNPAEGYLVTAVVNFDKLNLAEGATSTILANSDTAGFALELHNEGGTVLRFGVRVGGAYRYASLPATRLNPDDSFFIIGAYGGDGEVGLWIDNAGTDVTVTKTAGGVEVSDSPLVLGADPQEVTGRRYHFSGKIQQAQVQRWGPH